MNTFLYTILPTRVRRNYLGGAMIEAREGVPVPQDSNRPEDWIASTVRAVNPGQYPVADEGLTRVQTPDGRITFLQNLIAADPAGMLGERHVRRFGRDLGFLAKFLDSAIRLHVQAHPTAAFARQHLGSPYGKLETYVILAVRPGVEPYLRLGFQRAPSREEWRRIVETQDIAAMDACFDRVPLRVGDVWLVPGGMPHAIGEGVLMLEVMEPTDLVVRCEFEREGIVVPPAARFMGRGLEFCLDIFEYASRSVAQIARECRIAPVVEREENGCRVDRLVGPAQTGCFEVRRVTLAADTAADLPGDGRIRFFLVEHGAVETTGAGPAQSFGKLAVFLAPAAMPSLRLRAAGNAPAAVLQITPPG